MAISAALPRPGVHPWPMDTIPDPEVRERPTRRRFSAAYKVAILDEYEAAIVPGAKGAIIRWCDWAGSGLFLVVGPTSS